ncbi:MAG: PorV/PorQ family protein [Candidatus Firestonebacteria bacterium]|nr:PorV/PorQ family protein [Candidatus Firestonebacteria bacterium]
MPALHHRKFLWLWTIVCLGPGYLFPGGLCAADTNVSASFLDIPVGGRPAAMSGAYGAVSDDVFGLRYNPAGLGQLKNSALALQHNDWGLGMRQEFIAGALSLESGTLGAGISYMNYGAMEERDETGNRTGQTLSPTDIGVTGAYGFGGWGPNFFMGAAFTVIAESYYEASHLGISGDVGCKYRWLASNIDTGLSLRNIGTPISGYSLPAKLTAGVAARLFDNALLLSLDGDWPLADAAVQVAVGGEVTLLEFLALRLGYRMIPSEGQANVNGFTAGLGIYWEQLGISYAYQPLGDMAFSHRLALEYQFDQPFIHKNSPKPTRRKIVHASPTPPQAKGSVLNERPLPVLPDLENRGTRTAEVSTEEKKDALTHYVQGRKYYEDRRLDEAAEEYAQALVIYPGFVKARQALAVVKRERSREFVLKAIKPMAQRDVMGEAHRRYENGQELEGKGKWVDAAFAYKSALDIMPRFHEAEAALKRVQALVKAKSATIESGASVEKPILEDMMAARKPAKGPAKEAAVPDESMVHAIQKHMLAGNQALDHSDYQEAIREFELILEFDPNHKQAKYKLELARKKLAEEKDEAKQRASEAKQSGDKLEEAKALRTILVLDPTNKEARQAFKEARAKSRKEIDDLYKHGVTAYAQARYSDAIQIWNDVLDLDPEHVKAKESIAKAREKIKLIKEQ